MHVQVKCFVFCRVTLLDIIIAKVMADEPLTREEVPVYLSHAELFASTFVDQCRLVLKLTSEQYTDDEVRRESSWLVMRGEQIF